MNYLVIESYLSTFQSSFAIPGPIPFEIY